MDDTITIPLVMKKDDLWSQVFGSFEGYFDWWVEIDYVDTDWEKHGTVKLTAYSDVDSSEDTVTKEVTVEDLAIAYSEVIKKGYHHCGGKVDIEDMDECASDIILQQVMFGDVIYG